MTDADTRAEVVLGGQVLHVAGLSDMVWGHVSARDPAGRGAWIKAAGLGFDEVTIEDVLLVGWGLELREGRGRAHNECPIHLEILRARADVASVVHAHPPHAIALAASGRELEAFSHTAGIFATGVPRYDGAAGLVDSRESGTALAAALGSQRAIFLTGHGVVTVGASVGAAVTAAVMLERACQLQLLAEGFGGASRALAGARALTAYAHTQSDTHLLGAWRYLARQAQRSGP